MAASKWFFFSWHHPTSALSCYYLYLWAFDQIESPLLNFCFGPSLVEKDLQCSCSRSGEDGKVRLYNDTDRQKTNFVHKSWLEPMWLRWAKKLKKKNNYSYMWSHRNTNGWIDGQMEDEYENNYFLSVNTLKFPLSKEV